jgi:cytoskeletal protein RodZ
MEPRADRSNRALETVDPRTSLALWLRAGRTQRKLSLDDVARVTKIQPRILEKLEAGCFDGLPAEVFVKGFVRSVARCVGLDEREALQRYSACNGLTAPVARALVETMSELAPMSAMSAMSARKLEATPPNALPVVAVEAEPVLLAVEPVIEPIIEPVVEVVEVAEVAAPVVEIVAEPSVETKKKRSRKKAAGTGAPRSRKKKNAATEEVAVVAMAEPVADIEPVVIEPVVVEPAIEPVAAEPEPMVEAAPAIEVVDLVGESDPPWQPTMPPVAPSVPWRRPTFAGPAAFVAPSLVIDDADPESADLEREARDAMKAPNRVSFLPPILLDRDDKSNRQGGLTLAVIILLIAATITLSYLMRRPSLSGDGVTMAETISHRLA